MAEGVKMYCVNMCIRGNLNVAKIPVDVDLGNYNSSLVCNLGLLILSHSMLPVVIIDRANQQRHKVEAHNTKSS